eukprot:CAMPEP_0179169930 /NCGR_PEP_ID=MMETSP0796-20121207/83682_1 /TAXON_ID=73915 /ORGANISM="Pyrodinium bahamense, Strain pbaha01" /LENGTH=34 /DNA_ID= /DNA_START= /DNA_END= /DNA_ORIENTATION=
MALERAPPAEPPPEDVRPPVRTQRTSPNRSQSPS